MARDWTALATRMVYEERDRQISMLRYTPDFDDAQGSMVLFIASQVYAGQEPVSAWPWKARYYKPRGAVSDLVRSGALLLAAMDVEARAGRTWRPAAWSARLNATIDRLALTLAEAAEVIA